MISGQEFIGMTKIQHRSLSLNVGEGVLSESQCKDFFNKKSECVDASIIHEEVKTVQTQPSTPPMNPWLFLPNESKD